MYYRVNTLKQEKFVVDAELLRELGERLVGRQYIALAELVKNSFDADASKVEIRIQDDYIEVADNGHGMTLDDFQKRWMRVGSTHKVTEVMSPELQRPLTGSKGVGRLAVQFLAGELELVSVPKEVRMPQDTAPIELFVLVDWNQAVQAGELTNAIALYDVQAVPTTRFPLGRPHGTIVRLKKLKHDWHPEEFKELAREVWFLQPPFRSLSGTIGGENANFEVELIASDPKAVEQFKTQMSRILDLYRSRISGKLLSCNDMREKSGKRRVQLSLQLENQQNSLHEFLVPVRGSAPCLLNNLEFEIRVFTLRYRQAYGIAVQQAREYMNQWGGVHIYDAGFRIPYAGPSSDWLKLEFDHAHRLTVSQLLPSELNVRMGLNFLPTNSRVLGIVHIDTSREARVAAQQQPSSNQHLQIQVSRDRLVENDAFRQLQDAVRYALDYYAVSLALARKKEKDATRGVETPASLVQDVWDVLEQHQKDIPKPVANQLKNVLEKTLDTVREQSEWARSQAGLLGAMATVGATALAFDHQFSQQLHVLESHTTSLEKVVSSHPDLVEALGSLARRIRSWIRDARDTRAIFSPISDERNRMAVGRFRARPLIEDMTGNLRPILRGVTVEVADIEQELLLPEASYPAWMAIFHNVLMNSANAMLDSHRKCVLVSSFTAGKRRGIRFQDTGVGIDLAKAEDLFKPLHRDLEISQERQALGYGGMGLGLAIVRMLATDLKSDVRFIEPKAPFKTCFELAWNEDL